LNLLLDTHVALWCISNDPKLSSVARELISAPQNTVWVSSVNIWEISIKNSRRKKSVFISGKDSIDYFRQAGFQFLPVKPEHTVIVEELPHHHQDPFDRLLVAQALAEPMRLVTHDATVARYSDTIILV
jgi:PIN domain nuclease of toxin-antitoxin system